MNGEKILAVALAALITASSACVTAFAAEQQATAENGIQLFSADSVAVKDNNANASSSVRAADDEEVTNNVVAKIGDAEYASLQDAYDNATDGATITLCKDIVRTKADIEENKVLLKAERQDISKITLDLGGHSISFAEDAAKTECSLFRISYADFTIKNGKIDTTTHGGDVYISRGDNNAYIRLDVDITFSYKTAQVIFCNGRGVEFNGGTYKLVEDDYENYPYVGKDFYKLSINTSSNCPFTFNGGTFVNFDPLCQCKLAHYPQSGLGAGKAMMKKGGTFTVIDEADAVASIKRTVVCWKDWLVDATKERTYSYTSLQDAIDDIPAQSETFTDDTTVKVLKDIVMDAPADHTGSFNYCTISNKKVTVDFAGKTFSWSDAVKAKPANGSVLYSVFRLENAAELVITGDGKINSNLGTLNKFGHICVVKKGTLTIKNGTFTDSNQHLFIHGDGGVANIEGGSFDWRDHTGGEWTYKQFLNISGNKMTDSLKINITGGTFYDVDPRYLQDNYGTVTAGTSGILMVDSSKYAVTAKNVNGKKQFTVIPNDNIIATVEAPFSEVSAYVGLDMHGTLKNKNISYAYTTLADACDAATENDTVRSCMGENNIDKIFGRVFYINNMEKLNENYRVGFFATVKDLNFDSVGFDISAGGNDIEQKTTKVYSDISVTSSNGKTTKLEPSELGGNYIFGQIVQFPTSYKDTQPKFTPFAFFNGTKVFGSQYVVENISNE